MLNAEIKRRGSIDPAALERAVRIWLPAAGVSVEGQAKLLVNAVTGRLRGSITWATARERSHPTPEKSYTPNRADQVSAPTDKNVVYVGTNVEYAEYVEYGTMPHKIRVRDKKVLSDGDSFFGKVVSHPGIKPQEYLRKSIDALRKRLAMKLREYYDLEVRKTAVK